MDIDFGVFNAKLQDQQAFACTLDNLKKLGQKSTMMSLNLVTVVLLRRKLMITILAVHGSREGTHHGRDYSTDVNPYRSDNGVVIVELNGVQYDIDTCDKLEDQLLEPYLYKPQTGTTCPMYSTLPKTIDVATYKHCSTLTNPSTKFNRKTKLKRSLSTKQKRQFNPTLIKWTNRDHGEFKLIQTSEIARMWGEQKNNPGMTYEKLSRAMRYACFPAFLSLHLFAIVKFCP
ncbi:hypothetical protein KUTeg_023190 [Tegillarca granosa]|uniref:ETS domain-containing protein n=1 Tax=Tegillarca granosa TaxID=220873 RepID=A0ABQ9E6J0_TEGGR|nr:hypothetical protein KUTeg_023190 [Tegillarca granosa]